MRFHSGIFSAAIFAWGAFAIAPCSLAQQAGPLPVVQQQPAAASPAPATAGGAAVQPAGNPATAGKPATGSEPTATIELPSGTRIPLVLANPISTRRARVGDPVYLQTYFPVYQDGKLIIPAGSYASGVITRVKRATRGVSDRAGQLALRVTTLILPNGYQISFVGPPGNVDGGGKETADAEGNLHGGSDKGKAAATVAETTLGGAEVGSLATFKPEGGAIGAGIGAAAGLGAILLSRGKDVELPRGTTLEAILDRPLVLDASKIQFTNPGPSYVSPGPPQRFDSRVRPVSPLPFPF